MRKRDWIDTRTLAHAKSKTSQHRFIVKLSRPIREEKSNHRSVLFNSHDNGLNILSD